MDDTRDAPIKLRKVKRMDCIKLDADDRTYFTAEGYLVDHPILTSVGIFEYANPDGSVRRELRLPQNVFDEKSLKTYKGKPIIITHDAGVIDKGNVDKEQIGTILSEGYQDGEDVRAEIIIHDTDKMKDCGLKELSLGYNLDLIEEPGEWNGEPYDAIQTNIAINHLALVASARAGDQARLNIDGTDEPILKGGRVMAKISTSHFDGEEAELSPEELEKAVAMYKAYVAACEPKEDGEDEPKEEPTEEVTVEPVAQPVEAPEGEEKEDGEEEEPKAEPVAQPTEEPKAEPPKAGGDDLNAKVIAVLEKTIADLKGGNADEDDVEGGDDNADGDEFPFGGEPQKEEEEPKKEEVATDGDDNEGGSLNMDSADELFRQRLGICRVGDKLHLDGLESMSIKEGKKAIINRVFPSMRTDGKDRAYIDAMYDLACDEVNNFNGADYQRQQMLNSRADSAMDNRTSAEKARQRMLEREGGNE